MSVLSRSLSALVLAVVVSSGTGCAAPSPGPTALAPDESAAATVRAPSDSAPAERTRPAPPMSDPLPPERVPQSVPATPPASAVAALDRSCRTAADCAVKDVGNCCGAMPACVNTNARPDPDAVQAQCAEEGRASVCGFQEIRSCQCVQGQCEADNPAGMIR